MPLTARFSVSEACELLGVCRSTLHKWTRDGVIRANRRAANLRPYYTGKAIRDCWHASLF